VHLADTHLGYRDPADPDSFERAAKQFRYAIDFALEQRSAFVLLAGNVFHTSELDPATLQVAWRGLSLLAEKNVPAIAIRGRADLEHSDGAMNWYELLAQQGLLTVLEAETASEGQLTLHRWDRREAAGAYFELTRCRILGLRYYGLMTGTVLGALARTLNTLDNREMDFRILLLHAPLEHFCADAAAKLSFSDLLLLRRQIDYVALGGSNATYEAEGWAYNPGGAGFLHVTIDTAVQPKHTPRYVPYPAALEVNRPAAPKDRPRRPDLEDAAFDQLCASGGRDQEQALRRTALRLISQSNWGAANPADLARQLVELAGRDPNHAA